MTVSGRPGADDDRLAQRVAELERTARQGGEPSSSEAMLLDLVRGLNARFDALVGHGAGRGGPAAARGAAPAPGALPPADGAPGEAPALPDLMALARRCDEDAGREDERRLDERRARAARQRAEEEARAAEFEAVMAAWPVAAGSPLRSPAPGDPLMMDVLAEQRVRLAALSADDVRACARATEMVLARERRGSAVWHELQQGRALIAADAQRRRIRPGFTCGRPPDPRITARQALREAARAVFRDHVAAATYIEASLGSLPLDPDRLIDALRSDPRRFGRPKGAPGADALTELARAVEGLRRI